MKREVRNPKSHRSTEANDERTAKVVERYYGKAALLATWENGEHEGRIDENYLTQLRKTVRTLKSLLLHRADAKIKI